LSGLATITQSLTTKGIFTVSEPNLQDNNTGTPGLAAIALIGGILCLFLPMLLQLTLATPITIAVLIAGIIAAQGTAGRGVAIGGIATSAVALLIQATMWYAWFQVKGAVDALRSF